jgi:hypothetical protein
MGSTQTQGCRTQIAQEDIPAEIDLRLAALILSMDVETICERTGLAFSEQSTVRRNLPSVTDNSLRLPRTP